MERTLISLNVPNFLTISVMAIGGFILFAFVWQLVSKALGRNGASDETAEEGVTFAAAS